jgi:hypothetical protein
MSISATEPCSCVVLSAQHILIVRPDPTEGAEVIVFASHLLRMVDRLRPSS